MINEQFKLEGTSEIMNALKSLPVDIQEKVIKSLLTKVGRKFIVEPMKLKINYSPATENTITVVTNSKDKLSIAAGVSSKGYKLRWTDLGTKIRKTKKGYNRGSIQGKHQIQPLIESQIEPIVTYINEEMGEEINKILERRLKKLHKS